MNIQNITNNSNTTCHSPDSGVILGVANSDRLYTSVLVRINESCLVLYSEQNEQLNKSVHLRTVSYIS